MKTKDNPVLFIAEVSSNHHQDLDRCYTFIDKAVEIGCDGIKFQLFRMDKLFIPAVLEQSADHRKRKQWELPLEFIPALKDRCDQKGIMFGCTPFYLKAVKELAEYVDFLKIASYELLWTDLLAACGASGLPVILSTGMASSREIKNAVAAINGAGCQDLTLLHCVSGYPAPLTECNLAAISSLKNIFGRNCRIGWSDHSTEPAVLLRAVHHFQAEMVEFHLDIDGTGDEFSLGHCWLPSQISRIISLIRSGVAADGDGLLRHQSCEKTELMWRADPTDGLRPLKEIREKHKPRGKSND